MSEHVYTILKRDLGNTKSEEITCPVCGAPSRLIFGPVLGRIGKAHLGKRVYRDEYGTMWLEGNKEREEREARDSDASGT